MSDSNEEAWSAWARLNKYGVLAEMAARSSYGRPRNTAIPSEDLAVGTAHATQMITKMSGQLARIRVEVKAWEVGMKSSAATMAEIRKVIDNE